MAERTDVQVALFTAIKTEAERIETQMVNVRPAALLQLAQAYAYVTNPNVK